MKASITFRGDQQGDRPLLQAKVPISVLGLPFVSGLVAGEPAELRFDLATAFSAGPRLRLSYRPNDSLRPFAVSLKAGAGPFGSPSSGSPIAISAEFSLLDLLASPTCPSSSHAPAFFILLKPRFGDFSVKCSAASASSVASSSKLKQTTSRIVDDAKINGIEMLPVVDMQPLEFENNNGCVGSTSLNPRVTASTRFSVSSTVNARTGLTALLSGMQLSARSVLPLWNKATYLQFQWGLRVPPELQASTTVAAIAGDDDDVIMKRRASISSSITPYGKLPLLVMNKISVLHNSAKIKDDYNSNSNDNLAATKKKVKGAEESESDAVGFSSYSLLKRQLEALQAESAMMRLSVERLLHAETGSQKRSIPPGGGKDVIGAREDLNARAGSSPVSSTSKKTSDSPARGNANAGAGLVQKGAGKAAAGLGDVGEELKKALEDMQRK